jgi:hypothetical protein
MFPYHRSHSWISGGDHFLVKNLYVLAFGIIENGRSWLFSAKWGVVWPLIIDQRLVHLTPHMFPCHRSHSWISGGDHCWRLALKCYELRARQHKVLNNNVLRPRNIIPLGIMDLGRRLKRVKLRN